jgi:hypothetical protein
LLRDGSARRAALGGRMRELVAERVSAVEAKATTTTAKVPAAAASVLQKNRPTKVLKREPILALLPEGRCMVYSIRVRVPRTFTVTSLLGRPGLGRTTLNILPS